jgi:hypothetical protein
MFASMKTVNSGLTRKRIAYLRAAWEADRELLVVESGSRTK